MADVRRLQHDRYQVSIGEQGLPQAYVRGSAPSTQFAGATARQFERLGQGLSQLGQMAHQKEEEFNRLKVEDANNQFNRSLMELMNDPQNGWLHTRRQGDAIGMTNDFGRRSREIKDNLMKHFNMNDRQRQMFEDIGLRTAMPFFNSSQSHEARESERYRVAVHENMIETAKQSIFLNPFEPISPEHREMIMIAVSALNRGANQEVIQQGIDEVISGIEFERISTIGLDNPIYAMQLAQESLDLLNASRNRLIHRLREPVRREEARIASDEVFDQFGMDELSAWNFIQENFEGDMRNMVESQYFTRVGRLRSIENRLVLEAREHSRQLARDAMLESIRQGMPISIDQISQWIASGYIEAQTAEQMERWNRSFIERSGIATRLRDRMEGWVNLSQDERDNLVIREMFRVHDRPVASREITMNRLWEGILRGEVIREEVLRAYNDAYITTTERERMIQHITQIPRDRTEFHRDQSRHLVANAREIFGEIGILSTFTAVAQVEFDRLSREVPNDADYAEGIMRARAAALLYAVERAQTQYEGLGFLDENLNRITGNITFERYPFRHPELFVSPVVNLDNLMQAASRAAPGVSDRDISSYSTGVEFITQITPSAVNVANELGMLPSIVVAQAIKESDSGNNRIGQYNIFGAEADENWRGSIINAPILVYENGVVVEQFHDFRQYNSFEEAFEDYRRIMSHENHRAVREAQDYYTAARALQASPFFGYADYSDRLIEIIRQNRLYELDHMRPPRSVIGGNIPSTVDFIMPSIPSSVEDIFEQVDERPERLVDMDDFMFEITRPRVRRPMQELWLQHMGSGVRR